MVRDLCVATVSGQGLEGYREALARLKQELGRNEHIGRADRVAARLAERGLDALLVTASSTCAG